MLLLPTIEACLLAVLSAIRLLMRPKSAIMPSNRRTATGLNMRTTTVDGE